MGGAGGFGVGVGLSGGGGVEEAQGFVRSGEGFADGVKGLEGAGSSEV